MGLPINVPFLMTIFRNQVNWWLICEVKTSKYINVLCIGITIYLILKKQKQLLSLIWGFSFGAEADMLFLHCLTCVVADGAKSPAAKMIRQHRQIMALEPCVSDAPKKLYRIQEHYSLQVQLHIKSFAKELDTTAWSKWIMKTVLWLNPQD